MEKERFPSKVLISGDQIRNNAFKMALQLHEAGFLPTKMYAVLRGGVYVANPISEVFYYHYGKDSAKLTFGAVAAESYVSTRISEKREVKIIGYLPLLESITEHDKILITEDIVDTGDTLAEIMNDIETQTPLKRDMSIPLAERQIVVAAHDFKVRTFEKIKFEPDLWATKWIINSEEQDKWLHYTTHELIGLTKDEIFGMYGIQMNLQ